MNSATYQVLSYDNEKTWWDNNCEMPTNYTSIAGIVDSGSDNKSYTTRGTITSIEGDSYFIQSQNRGLYIYNTNAAFAGFNIGNVVDVTGTRTTYSGLVELKPTTATTLYQSTNPHPVVTAAVNASDYDAFCTSANISRIVALRGMQVTNIAYRTATFDYEGVSVTGYITNSSYSALASQLTEYKESDTLVDFIGILAVYNTTYQARLYDASALTEHANVPVSSIEVTPANPTVNRGDSVTFSANVLPSNASNSAIVWSTNGGGTIDESGVFQANDAGTYMITATAQDGSGVFGGATVTINNSSTITEGYTLANPQLSGDTLGPIYVPGTNDTISFTYLEMVQEYGDSMLFDYGNFEVLIDAGTAADEQNVMAALSNCVTDECLELLIVTHPHSDHLGGLQNASSLTGVGISSIKYIVDFGGTYATSAYNNYVTFRNYFIGGGSVYYSIYEMINNATSLYPNIFSVCEGLTMRFLDSGAYVPYGQSITNLNESSVCTFFSFGNNRILTCGDLTNAGGASNNPEAHLVNQYGPSGLGLWDDTTTNIVKANHHCSGTNGSNGAVWVNGLTPDYVFVSAAIISANRSENTGGEGPTTSQHPNATSLARYLAKTSDVYCNIVNGTSHFNFDSFTSDPTLSFDGRTLDYSDAAGNIVSAELEKDFHFADSSFYAQLYA
ncbi:MAG: Ig-like domain-containing protein [Bacilli bacterium]